MCDKNEQGKCFIHTEVLKILTKNIFFLQQLQNGFLNYPQTQKRNEKKIFWDSKPTQL